uniref:Uncharacterized protein n=1 Tax=Ciona savignyi TaxID=51511 RepID=H2YBR8_CIOSA
MLVCMGIDSQFAMVEVVNTTLTDMWGGKLLTCYFKRKELLVLCVCLVAFLLGIPNLMQGGIYVFTLLDNYTAIVSLMFLAFFEVIAICWLYGGRRVAKDVQVMTGTAPSYYFIVCWIIIAPMLIGVILIFSIIKYKPAHYGTYTYPGWADGIGWLVALSSMLCIPIGAFITIFKLNGSFLERMKQSIKPVTCGKDAYKGGEAQNNEDIISDPPSFSAEFKSFMSSDKADQA